MHSLVMFVLGSAIGFSLGILVMSMLKLASRPLLVPDGPQIPRLREQDQAARRLPHRNESGSYDSPRSIVTAPARPAGGARPASGG